MASKGNSYYEREMKELTKLFTSIEESIESDKLPEQNDVEACKKILGELGESFDGFVLEATKRASGLLEKMNSKLTQLLKDKEKFELHKGDLQNEIPKLKEEVEKLKEYVKTMETKLEEQDQKIKTLETNVEALQKDNLKLKKKYEILKVCQITWMIEYIVINTVLPNNNQQTFKIQKIKDMERALNGPGLNNRVFATADEKYDAKSEWHKLRAAMNWDDELSPVILKTIKAERIPIAHPMKKPHAVRRMFNELKENNHHFQEIEEYVEWCLSAYEALWKIVPNAQQLAERNCTDHSSSESEDTDESL